MKDYKLTKTQDKTKLKSYDLEIIDLLDIMRSVDIDCELAKLNETSMLDRSDEKGRRIKF